MKPIALFYHCLFFTGEPRAFSTTAFDIIRHQINQAHQSGLLPAARYVRVGINGGQESEDYAALCFPETFELTFHGPQSRCENPTLRALEQWLPGHEDWLVFYFHSKGATKPAGDSFTGTWRDCMMRHTVDHWQSCVRDLERGYDAAGCHWMEPPATPAGQYIFAGTFWWATGNYLLTLPSIMERDRIKTSGLDAFESRYEAEVWIGNGPRKPKVRDYHGPLWNPSKIATCHNS